MIVEKVDLRGFGSLSDRIFCFSSGFNVVVGPNETGKSTLLHAIQALLYGHFQDKNLWLGVAARDRFRPWSGAEYAGAIRVSLANGERYRIERNFADERTSVFRDPGTTDVTALYKPSWHGWVDFADRHLGLSPTIFRASACIQQGDPMVDRVGVKLLYDRLEQLADSGGADQSARHAGEVLAAWLASRVNPDAAVEKSPIKQATAAVQALRDRLQRARDALDDLARVVAEEKGYSDAKDDLGQQIQKLDGLVAWHEAAELAAKLQSLAEVEQRIGVLRAAIDRVADLAPLTDASFDAPSRALEEVSRLRDEVDRFVEQARHEEVDLGSIDHTLAEIAEELNRLPVGTFPPVADLEAARLVVEQWEGAARHLGETRERLPAIQQRRLEVAADRDARLGQLPGVTVDELRQAVMNAVNRRDRLAAIERQVAEQPSEATIRAELQVLQAQLRLLDSSELARIHTLAASQTGPDSLERAPRAIPVWPFVGLGVVVGLGTQIMGYQVIVSVVGGGGFAAVTVLTLWVNRGRRATQKLSNHPRLLDEWLSEYGVRSADELQQRWDRRAQLQEQASEGRRLQESLATARRELASAIDHLEMAISTRDVNQAKELLDRVEAARSEETDLDRMEQESRDALERAESDASERQAEACTALTAVGIAAEEPTQARQSVDRFLADYQRHAALVEQQSDLLAKANQHHQTLAAVAERKAQLAAAEDLARASLATIGIIGDPADWASDLARLRESLQTYRDLTHELDLQEQIQQALLGKDDPAGWRAALAERQPLAIRPDEGDTRTLDELRHAARELLSQLDTTQNQLMRIEERRQELNSRLEDPAEIEEQLAEAVAQHSRLQHRAEVLQEARRLIASHAVTHHKQFAPRLQELVSSSLDRATSHRYARVGVSPTDLSIQLESTERGDLIGLDQVSQGTRDTVALLFRASVVDLLGNGDEPAPLFLDDPLVHVDSQRTQHLIDILYELAEYRQIIYFTQDQRIVGWCQQRGECRVNRMTHPAG